MLGNVLSLLVLEFCCIMSYTVKEHLVTTTSSFACLGDVMEETVGVTIVYCNIICADNTQCTGVKYFPSNKTCILLHVEDVLDDWVNNDDEDVEYSCVNCEPDPKGTCNTSVLFSYKNAKH